MSENESNELHRLFYPRNIAMVGATPKREVRWSSGNSYILGSITNNFPGKIFPVHPSGKSILGFKSYKRIADIPANLDLVIFTVRSTVALEVMKECADKGVKFVHLLTAGFSETGRKEHADMEKELISIAKKGGVRIVGPNCMGLYCPEGGLAWGEGYPVESGPIGFFSQSGQLAGEFVQGCTMRGLRFSKLVSYGNASDLKAHDFLEYLAQDEKTKIIGSYIEGLKDGRAFFDVAKKVTSKKPLVIWKGGQTEGGSRATQSHTAAIAGSPQIWQALCKQAGIISVGSMEELIYTVTALNGLKLPDGVKNIAVFGGAGGGSVTMTDAAEQEGLRVPHLTEETIQRLEEFIPLQGNSSKNPLDINVLNSKENLMQLMTLLRDDPNIDAMIITLPILRLNQRLGQIVFSQFIQDMIEAKERLAKPLLAVLRQGEESEAAVIRREIEEIFRDEGIPAFPTFQLTAKVLSNLIKYREFISVHE